MYHIYSTDGAKIAVYDLNPEAYKTMLLIHGWPLSHKMFEYQAQMLINLGYRIVTIDIRGFGKSDETAFGYEYNQLATDLYCIIKELNLSNITLVGFSMGGGIVTRYMKLYNGYEISKLCYWDAAVPSYSITRNNPYGAKVEETNRLITWGYQDRPALNEYFGSIFFAREHSAALKDWFQQMSNSASGIGQMQTLMSLRDEDVFQDMQAVRVPTGIFHGKLDKICAYEMALIVNKQIRNSRLYSFERGGHGTFYDELEKFNQTFKKFLEE